MPELPEVEVTRRGLAGLLGRRVTGVATRAAALRYPLPKDLARRLGGKVVRDIGRRGKYLLFAFDDGHLLVHLGMSGSLRLTRAGEAPAKHDHLDLVFGRQVLRLRDPRRFGAVLWLTDDPASHPLLAGLGLEPLERGFTPARLSAALAGRRTAIKPALMDARLVVGVGNIYASESLFAAGIDPRRPAGELSAAEAARLVPAIKATLRRAIRAGGSSLRDYVQSDGGAGSFQLRHHVYGRGGEPCRHCGTPIRALRQTGRATYYCPRCQR
ncbi:MAG TPA: bifunctional DNA-formamidopyrimidine glycosylase/DNA-(apurinic or apyrimidinic site) lyase [Rhodocyclaceae bacterium]|nr:bifunctional DNA-formamidopyrimidine glycosylase/DNA-(apurinic or apyrimidinic site) lyase [Rhodocyclaceae bacterium]